jgi:hypothetical protein
LATSSACALTAVSEPSHRVVRHCMMAAGLLPRPQVLATSQRNPSQWTRQVACGPEPLGLTTVFRPTLVSDPRFVPFQQHQETAPQDRDCLDVLALGSLQSTSRSPACLSATRRLITIWPPFPFE